MEEIHMKAVRLLFALFLVASLASCTLEPTWSLDGKWQQAEGSEIIQFSKNGTVNMDDQHISLTTQYAFIDPEHIRIDLGSLGNFVMKVSVSRNELTLTSTDGTATKYRKLN
jgi:hypothetical protein